MPTALSCPLAGVLLQLPAPDGGRDGQVDGLPGCVRIRELLVEPGAVTDVPHTSSRLGRDERNRAVAGAPPFWPWSGSVGVGRAWRWMVVRVDVSVWMAEMACLVGRVLWDRRMLHIRVENALAGAFYHLIWG
eukprot:365983-Chlamydomonas_euryale.AAC.25